MFQLTTVVIDLGGKTLYQSNANAGTNGIEIQGTQKNILIKNGSIVGFQGAGIYVNPGCDTVRIQDVTISSCGKQGIYFAGTASTGGAITNCSIENSIVARTTGIATTNDAIGIELDYCQNIGIARCMFCGNDGSALARNGVGAYVVNSSNITFDHCDASSNKGTVAYGFKITGTTSTPSSTCSFLQCSARNNSGILSTSGNGYGFFASLINSCKWYQCVAANNQGTLNGYGFYLQSSLYASLQECQSVYNQGGLLGALSADGGRGFLTSQGIGNSFEKCTALGNQTISTTAATRGIGFDMQSETFCTLSECIAQAQGSDTLPGWSIGMNMDNSTKTFIKKSHLLHNRSLTTNQGVGITDSASSSSTLITDCFFFGNGQGLISNNFSVVYTAPGEVNSTASVSAGHMGGLSIIKPFQNVTVTS